MRYGVAVQFWEFKLMVQINVKGKTFSEEMRERSEQLKASAPGMRFTPEYAARQSRNLGSADVSAFNATVARVGASLDALAKRLDSFAPQTGRGRSAGSTAGNSTQARAERAEERLIRRFMGLEDRAKAPLTPASYRTMARQIGLLERETHAFAQSMGRAAGIDPAGLRASLGSEGNAYRVQNINRLGNLGGKAADERSWRTLASVERELKRIEKLAAEELKLAKTDSQRTDATRKQTAIGQARERISAAKAGIGGFSLKTGEMLGAAAIAMPELAPLIAAGVIAYETASVPFKIAGRLQSIAGVTKPYFQYQMQTAALANAGNFGAGRLREGFLPGGLLNTGVPGLGRPAWMQALGLGPNQALANTEGTGIAPRYPEMARTIASSVRSAFMSPGIGLPENQLAAGLGQAFQLGSAKPTEASINKYFRELQSVTTSAVAEGTDRSRAMQTLRSLMERTANQSLTGPNAQFLADLENRLLGSGAPRGRTGEAALSIAGGLQSAASNLGIGGAPSSNVLLGSYFSRHGGTPTTAEGLRKALGMSADQFQKMTSTPAAKLALKTYLEQAKSNNPLAFNYLGQLLSGNQDVMAKIMQDSLSGMTPGQRFIAESNVTGSPLGDVLSYESGKAPGGIGAAPVLPGSVMGQLGAGNAPQSAFMGLIASESSGRQLDKNGNLLLGQPTPGRGERAMGIGQVMPTTAEAMMGWQDSPENRAKAVQLLSTQSGNLMIARKKYEQEWNRFSDISDPIERARAANLGYKSGYSKDRIEAWAKGGSAAGMDPSAVRGAEQATAYGQGYGNFPLQGANVQATAEAAGLAASRYGQDLVSGAVNAASTSITFLGNEAQQAGQAVGKFASELESAWQKLKAVLPSAGAGLGSAMQQGVLK